MVHCVSERQARYVRRAIEDRMVQVGLRLHPDKTRIVYCKDGKRRGAYGHTSFTFLGYAFRARSARDRRGNIFTSFLPAISKVTDPPAGGPWRRCRSAVVAVRTNGASSAYAWAGQ